MYACKQIRKLAFRLNNFLNLLTELFTFASLRVEEYKNATTKTTTEEKRRENKNDTKRIKRKALLKFQQDTHKLTNTHSTSIRFLEAANILVANVYYCMMSEHYIISYTLTLSHRVVWIGNTKWMVILWRWQWENFVLSDEFLLFFLLFSDFSALSLRMNMMRDGWMAGCWSGFLRVTFV